MTWCLTILTCSDYYMDERCGEEIDMQDDDIETGTLDLTIFLTYKPSMNCQLTIKAPDDKQIMIYFTEIDMKEKKRRYGNTCEDYLELFDGSTTSNHSVPGSDLKICGDYEPKTAYYTSGQYLTLRFTSDYRRQDRGFVLLFTSFHTGLCNGTKEFQCRQGQCISKSFQNDGYSQCGDYSDELITDTDMDHYAVGAVVVIICIIVATCYFCKRCKQRGAVIKRSGNQSEIPLTSQPVSQPFQGQQPGYQQQPAVYQHQPASYPQQHPGYPQQPAGYPQQPGYHPLSGNPPQPVYTDHIGHPQPRYVPLPGNPQPGYAPLPEKLPQPSNQSPPGYPSQPNYQPQSGYPQPGYHLVDPPPYTESPYPSAPPKQ